MKISDLPLLSGFSDAELEEMKSGGFLRRKAYARREVILHCGSVTREVGIVASGRVHIESIDLGGGRSILSSVGAGQVFAETYALCGESLMVDAVAAADSEIIFLHTRAVAPQAQPRPWQARLTRSLLAASMRKNLELSSRIFCTAPKTIRQRLLTYFAMQSAKADSAEFDIPFDRQQLADYLNLDRSALSKELGKMRDDGLIAFSRSHFVMLRGEY